MAKRGGKVEPDFKAFELRGFRRMLTDEIERLEHAISLARVQIAIIDRELGTKEVEG